MDNERNEFFLIELRSQGFTDDDLNALHQVHARQIFRDTGKKLLYFRTDDQGLERLAKGLKPEPYGNNSEFEELRKKFQSVYTMYEFNRSHKGTKIIDTTAVVSDDVSPSVMQPVSAVPNQNGTAPGFPQSQSGQRLFNGLIPQQPPIAQGLQPMMVSQQYPTKSMVLLQGYNFDAISCGEYVYNDKPAKRAKVSDLFLAVHSVKQKDGAIFMKRNGHFEILTDKEFSKVISTFCFSQAQKADSARYIKEVKEMILADPRTEVSVDGADIGNLVFTSDGMVYDICNGTLTQSTFDFSSSYIDVPSAAFKNDVSTPAWDYLINTQYGHLPTELKEKFTKNFKQCIGYMLSGDITRRKIIILQGATGSGKSTVERVLEKIFPPNQSTGIRLSDLSKQFTMAGTGNLRLITVPDMPAKVLSAETVEILKVKSGYDNVSSDVKYKDRENIFFKGKIMMVTNHYVTTIEDDPAFTGRLQVVPFFVTPPHVDANLFAKLLAESPYFMVKCLKAYGEMCAKGEDFAACDYSVNACLSIRPQIASLDYLTMFLNEKIVKDPGGFVSSDDFYYSFVDFARSKNITGSLPFALDNKLAFNRYLGKKMKEFGIAKAKQRVPGHENPLNGYAGIGLLNK